MVTILTIIGMLALISSVVPLGILFLDRTMFKEYWPTVDVDIFWIVLLVGLLFMALARILAEVQDMRDDLDAIRKNTEQSK